MQPIPPPLFIPDQNESSQSNQQDQWSILDKSQPLHNSPNIRASIHQNIPIMPNSTLCSPIVKVINYPGRAVSTFPAVNQIPKKHNAAPFPTLPSKLEIIEQKNKVEHELQCMRAELSSLIHERNFVVGGLSYYNSDQDKGIDLNFDQENNEDEAKAEDSQKHSSDVEDSKQLSDEEKASLNFKKNSTVIPTDIVKSTTFHGVMEYHNILLSDPIIESVIKSNRSKKIESETTFLPPKLRPKGKFKSINELPLFQATIDDVKENIAPIFAAHFESRELINQKQHELTTEYVNYFSNNQHYREKVDEYNCRIESVSDNWPTDFPKGKTKNESEAELNLLAAPDEPMLMTKTRLDANCYYNTNGFVPDPVTAHEAFKNRISWSEDEKQTFVSKYMQHPKKFSLIANSLPLKSVKDVIEFYYVNRYTLSLKEKETARRKRGGKKKVISEGSAKT